MARVPALARFFDNLTEIMRVKERVVELFFTEAVQHCPVMWCSWFKVHCYHSVEKQIVRDMTTRNQQFLINKHKQTALLVATR